MAQALQGEKHGCPASREELRRGGSIVSRRELAGDHRFLDSERQTMKEEHQETEKHTANSTRHLAQAEGARTELAATAERELFGEIQNTASEAARVRMSRLRR